MDEKKQDEFIGELLKLSPIELAESMLLIYGNDLLKGLDNDFYSKTGHTILERCREELVKVGTQYQANVGLTMRDLLHSKGIDLSEHQVY